MKDPQDLKPDDEAKAAKAATAAKAVAAVVKKLEGGTEDSTLTRAVGDSSQEKYRCTFEARHIILNYADPATEAPLQQTGVEPL